VSNLLMHGAVRSDAPSSTDSERIRRNWTAIVAVALLAVGVLALQSFLHGHYSAVDEYDDGVYFGSSVELIHGVIAYRDFAFIQPPLVTVWLAPFAAFSNVTGTAIAMEMARVFVDLVTVTNVVLVGVLVRRRTTLQVIVATSVMAFSQGTIRSSQTILLEPFLVLASLVALVVLIDRDEITGSSRRLWWCGVLFGVAGATKIWAVFPLAAVLLVLSSRGVPALQRIAGGAMIGFGVCCLPFIITAPIAFFQQVVFTQAIRNGGGFSLRERLADLTGIPGFSSFVQTHALSGVVLLFFVLCLTLKILLLSARERHVRPWSPLERIALWGGAFVVVGLLISPTYYYHYSGFMAPFVALVMSACVVRVKTPVCGLLAVRSILLPDMLALFVVPTVIASLLGTIVTEVVNLPAAPHVVDAVSDAIPGRGCVLFANPTLALLDNRFTSDVSGCPDVIDWLGQERVLDNGRTAGPFATNDGGLQEAMAGWIESSDAVVLGNGNVGLDGANVDYLAKYFNREPGVPRPLRIYVRDSRRAS
jgi:alpha-1,2-mannosyltransferase